MDTLINLHTEAFHNTLQHALHKVYSQSFVKMTDEYLLAYMWDEYQHCLTLSELDDLREYCERWCKVKRNRVYRQRRKEALYCTPQEGTTSDEQVAPLNLDFTNDQLYRRLLEYSEHVLQSKKLNYVSIQHYMKKHYQRGLTSQELTGVRKYCKRCRDAWSTKRRRARMKLQKKNILYVEDKSIY